MRPRREWHDGWYPNAVGLRAITQTTERLRYGNDPFIRFAVARSHWHALETVFHALRVVKDGALSQSDWSVTDWQHYRDTAPQTFFAPDTSLTDAEIALRNELAVRSDNSKKARLRLRFQEGYSYAKRCLRFCSWTIIV
ncbi:MAG: hypothetical protein H7Y38_11725 [Armatimonadetes bacterium]|nr:hypothetical protein [Armatimonadota bacterium]